MPLDLCHPTAPHEKRHLPNWFVSNLMIVVDQLTDRLARAIRIGRP